MASLFNFSCICGSSSPWTRVALLSFALILTAGFGDGGAGKRATLSVAATPAKLDAANQAEVVARYGELPLSFESNQGQVDEHVKFLSRGIGYTLFLTADEAVLSLRGTSGVAKDHAGRSAELSTEDESSALLRMKLVGANPSATVSGIDEQAGKSNYFVGNDPAKWRTNVTNYSSVRYKNAYPGVDLVYYGNHRQLEYDLVVAPDADPGAILLDIAADGRRPLRVAANGDLVVNTAVGEVRFRKPTIYQPEGNSEQSSTVPYPITARHSVDGRWVRKGKSQVGFEIGAYDKRQPLIIDPALYYSTFVGGTLFNPIFSAAVDSSGNAYVTGNTTSTNFPTTTGAYQTKYAGSHDAFVTKVNASGTAFVYSTYLGGNGIDHGSGIAVDGSGNAYVAGTTSSKNYPVTAGAFQSTCGGCAGGNPDGFVTKLNPAGTALLYSTYLGGSDGYEHVDAIAVDGSGDAYITGFTCSTDFPTTPGAFQTTYKGACTLFGGNARITELNPTGTAPVYSTYLGGTGTDCANSITVDSLGNTYVAGYTNSTDFPAAGEPYQSQNHGANDVFVSKLNPGGSTLVYSTYIGGSDDDQAWGVRVDPSGNAYVVGQTLSTDFPVSTGAFQTTCGSCTGSSPQTDGFVAKVNATGSALPYSTYLGGTGEDTAFAVAVSSTGEAYVAGETGSRDFPVTPGAFQSATTGGISAYVTHLNAKGSSEVYSTYFGNGATTILGIGLNNVDHSFVVAGRTYSPLYPTTPGAVQTTCPTCNLQAKNADGFVARFVVGDQIWPLTLTFAPQAIGSSSVAQVTTLSNSGATVLNVSNIQITGTNAVDFSESDTCGSPVAAGASCAVSVTFMPSTNGAESATLTVTDNASNSPQHVIIQGTGSSVKLTPASINFGNQKVGTPSSAAAITLMNQGSTALHISKISVVGTNAGDFSETSTCAASLPRGAKCSISVTFAPTVKGKRTAAVSINDDGAGSPQQVSLTGNGN
jgi:Beta-propeller repeat/Abnormal spindle-like microcephaly-assoc'd, ASPM-SPD-2-Hydin